MEETSPPRVFISYSHDSVEHQQRVLALADRLRAGGVDAEIDQYNPAPPEGWPLWCERQVEAADFVLMICTESYHRRVRGGEAPGQGLGVVWEARIIRQLLYDAGAVSSKFIPVLFSGSASAHIPTPVKGGSWYVVDTEQGMRAFTGGWRTSRRLSGRTWANCARCRRGSPGGRRGWRARPLRLRQRPGTLLLRAATAASASVAIWSAVRW